MKMIHLQDDPYYYDQFDDAEVVVTRYEIGDYSGSGEALVYRNGKIEYYDLGHCSCYGPFEGTPDIMTLEQFLDSNGMVTCFWGDEIGRRFLFEAGLTASID